MLNRIDDKEIRMTAGPFQIRGVVEGFYGPFYTFPERDDLICFLGTHGFNLSIYAPKNDWQHRNRWREPYPKAIVDKFAQTLHVAREAGVTFCYALRPGVSISYSSEADYHLVQSKLRAFYDLGVRSFSLLLDDILPDLIHARDGIDYTSLAEAQAKLCNRTGAWLKSLDPACTLNMCPTDYSGDPTGRESLRALGEMLHPEIDISYTGTDVCVPEITGRDAAAFAEVARRRPLIWDNYPVNDLTMDEEMHLAPVSGRATTLYRSVRGIVVNPMIQAEASKAPVITYANYLPDPARYNPQAAWEKALCEVAGGESYIAFRRLAENSLPSCLQPREFERLDSFAQVALASLWSGVSLAASLAFHELKTYLDELDEACYHLLNPMVNLALWANLLPWIELLNLYQSLGRYSLRVIEGLQSGMDFEQDLRLLRKINRIVRRHPKRIAGKALLPMANYALAQVDRRLELAEL